MKTAIDEKIIGTVNTTLTEEFCDSCNNYLVDTWLYRRCMVNNERQYAFFTRAVTDRIEFYDGIQSICPVVTFVSFSKFKLGIRPANEICLDTFITHTEELAFVDNLNLELQKIDHAFREFLNLCFVPYLEGDRSIGPTNTEFARLFCNLVYDDDSESYAHDFSEVIETVRLIEKAKSVFCKYYVGAYIHLDEFYGMFTSTENLGVNHSLHRGEQYHSFISESDIISITNGVAKERSIKTADIPVLQLAADLNAILATSGIKITDRVRAATNLTLQSIKATEGIFENYAMFRERPQGDMLRTQLVALTLNNLSYGGAQYEATFQFDDE
jgi:hypothetical protein